MKNLLIALFCITSLLNIAYAEDAVQVSEDNKVVISAQKQPTNERQTPRQKITRNIACIIIQFNGKSENLVKGKSTK